MIGYRFHLVCTSLLASVAAAHADDVKKPEQLPPPRVVATENAAVLPPPTVGFMRTDRYAVWQNYAVDRQGHFRARVIQSPHGAYYHYNGKPYPWPTVQPLKQAPSVID